MAGAARSDIPLGGSFAVATLAESQAPAGIPVRNNGVMAPFTLKGTRTHRAARVRVVVMTRFVAAFLVGLRGCLRMRVARSRPAARRHGGVGAAGVARFARAAVPALVRGLVECHGPRGVIVGRGQGLGMAPFTIERPEGVRVVVLARGCGAPHVMRFRGGLQVRVAGRRRATGGCHRVGAAAPFAAGASGVNYIIVARFASRLPGDVRLMAERKEGVGNIDRVGGVVYGMAIKADPREGGMPNGVTDAERSPPAGDLRIFRCDILFDRIMALVALFARLAGGMIPIRHHRGVFGEWVATGL